MVSCVSLVVQCIQSIQVSKSAGLLFSRWSLRSTPMCSQCLRARGQHTPHIMLKEMAASHIPIPESLGPRNNFSRLGFVVRQTPANISKFLPYDQRLFARHGGPSNVDGKRQFGTASTVRS